MTRAEVAALRTRIADWLKRTRRLETDDLVPGVVARTALLGKHLVIHESSYRSSYRAHDLLVVADARSGALVFVSEWRSPTGEDSTPIAVPAALAAISADLAASAAGAVH